MGVNDEEVGALATRHLAEVGSKRIAHIGGSELSPVVGRMEGYKRTLLKLGLASGPELIYNVDRVEELGDGTGYEATKKLLKQSPQPDGIFCYNDAIAYGAIAAVLDSGLRVPEDSRDRGCETFSTINSEDPAQQHRSTNDLDRTKRTRLQLIEPVDRLHRNASYCSQSWSGNPQNENRENTTPRAR